MLDKTNESLAWNIVLPSAYQAIRFAFSIIIARILNPNDFGIMGLASIIIFYSNSLTNFGFSTALVRKKNINDRHVSTIFTLNLLLSIVLFLILIFSAKYISLFFKIKELKEVLLLLSIIFIITSFYTIPVTLLRRELKFKIIVKIEFIRGISQSIVTLLLALQGFQYWSLVIGNIFSQIFATLIIVYISNWKPKADLHIQSFKDLINFSSWSFVNGQLRLLNDYVDKLIIGKFLGSVYLGYYEKSFQIAFTPIQSISQRISGVMFSSFSRSNSDLKKIHTLLDKSLIITSLLIFPINFGLISIAPLFVKVLLGNKWVPMVPVFQILLLAFILLSLTNILEALNMSSGYYKSYVKGRGICILFLIILCMSFVQFGNYAIALCYLLYHFILFVFSLMLANNKFKFNLMNVIKNIFPSLLISLMMFSIIKYLSYYLSYNLINLFCLAILGFFIYFVGMISLNFKQNSIVKSYIKRIYKYLVNELIFNYNCLK